MYFLGLPRGFLKHWVWERCKKLHTGSFGFVQMQPRSFSSFSTEQALVVADVEIPHPFTILKKLAWALRKSQKKAGETSTRAKEAAGTINTVRALLAFSLYGLPNGHSRWADTVLGNQERKVGHAVTCLCPGTRERLWEITDSGFCQAAVYIHATYLGGMKSMAKILQYNESR